MNVDIVQGRRPRLERADVNVVIDVIRAFTVAHIALRRGASRHFLAAEIDEARRLARGRSNCLLLGERQGLKIDGFDLGNSPADASDFDFEGKTVVQTTTNGTQAAVHADEARFRLVTGYSNASATAAWIRRRAESENLRTVNLVASHPTGDDDMACAEFIRDRLLGTSRVSRQQVERRIRESGPAEKFLAPDREEFERRDVLIAATANDGDFAMGLESTENTLEVKRWPVGS